MSDQRQLTRSHGLGLNLAIGPSCFVQCHGCYNAFGATASRGGLVTRAEIKAFASAAADLGIEQVTVSGGDPLTHPEIIQILDDLDRAGFYIKVDTVGTALLRDANEVFYGNDTIPRIDIAEFAETIDMVGFPLDAVTAAVQGRFRRSRPAEKRPTLSADQLTLIDAAPQTHTRSGKPSSADITADTPELVRLFTDLPVEVCVNTVVHAQNASEIRKLATLVRSLRPDLWQLFEYQPLGALGGRNGDRFTLAPATTPTVSDIRAGRRQRLLEVDAHPFEDLTRIARSIVGDVTTVEGKSDASRRKIYFMVNDAGLAWLPGRGDAPAPTVIGHIGRDINQVRRALADAVAQSSRDLAG